MLLCSKKKAKESKSIMYSVVLITTKVRVSSNRLAELTDRLTRLPGYRVFWERGDCQTTSTLILVAFNEMITSRLNLAREASQYGCEIRPDFEMPDVESVVTQNRLFERGSSRTQSALHD